jgi:hypothetical protein
MLGTSHDRITYAWLLHDYYINSAFAKGILVPPHPSSSPPLSAEGVKIMYMFVPREKKTALDYWRGLDGGSDVRSRWVEAENGLADLLSSRRRSAGIQKFF